MLLLLGPVQMAEAGCVPVSKEIASLLLLLVSAARADEQPDTKWWVYWSL